MACLVAKASSMYYMIYSQQKVSLSALAGIQHHHGLGLICDC